MQRLAASSAIRKPAVQRHNRRSNVQAANFAVGYFVLVRSLCKGGHKLRFKWQLAKDLEGPRRITRVVADLVYEIQNFFSERLETIHAQRLLLWRADMDRKEISPELLKAAEHFESLYQNDDIRDIRARPDTIKLEVQVE